MENSMRTLKVATIVMGVLLVVGTLGLAVALMRRNTAAVPPAAAVTAPALAVSPGGGGLAATLTEPEGTHIAAMMAIADRLAVQLQGGGADRIVLIDPRTGAVTGRISLVH